MSQINNIMDKFNSTLGGVEKWKKTSGLKQRQGDENVEKSVRDMETVKNLQHKNNWRPRGKERTRQKRCFKR